MSAPTIALSIALFLLAGLMEIGGGYLVWQCLREGAAVWVGPGGLVCLLGVAVIMYWPRA